MCIYCLHEGVITRQIIISRRERAIEREMVNGGGKKEGRTGREREIEKERERGERGGQRKRGRG